MIRQDDTADLTRAALRRAVILTTAYYHGLRIHRAPNPHNDSPLVASTGSAPLDAPAGGAGSFTSFHAHSNIKGLQHDHV